MQNLKGGDAVSGGGFWKILGNLACQLKFLAIVHQLHEGQLDTFWPLFPIGDGTKKDCILTPYTLPHLL